MATVNGYTAERMKEIEDSAIVGGSVVGNNLMLTRHDNTQFTAGNVRGPQGVQGPQGVTSISVCTSTTRPTGVSLFTGLAIYETDTKLFYIYDGTTWIYRGGLYICTSTTRPSNPFQGLEIFETDTKKFFVYNGVRFDPPWNQPWGIIAYSQSTLDQNDIGTTEVDLTNLTTGAITLVANRRIELRTFARGGIFSNSNVNYIIRLYDNVTLLQEEVFTSNAVNALHAYTVSRVVTPSAGSHTYKLRGIATVGTFTIAGISTSPSHIMAVDIGPNGLPV